MSEVLSAIAETLNRSPDVVTALTETLKQVARLLALEGGWVWLTNPETDQFYLAAAYNLPHGLQEPVRMVGEPCWCLQSFRAGRLLPQNLSILQCSRLRAAETPGSHASIPLYSGDRPLGIMNLAAPDFRTLTPQELEFLTTVAFQVGIAVERARLAETAARAARLEERSRLARDLHDTLAQGLTGLGGSEGADG